MNESSQLLRQLASPELPPPHLAAWQAKPDELRDILQVISLESCRIPTGAPVHVQYFGRYNQIQTILMVATNRKVATQSGLTSPLEGRLCMLQSPATRTTRPAQPSPSPSW